MCSSRRLARAIPHRYKEVFRTESMRIDLEDARFGPTELAARDERVMQTAQQILDLAAARDLERDLDEASHPSQVTSALSLSRSPTLALALNRTPTLSLTLNRTPPYPSP